MAALALAGVIGVLALLQHGIAVPFAQHVEQVSRAQRQTAPALPPADNAEPVASETTIEILAPAESEPPAPAFPAPEEFAKLLATEAPEQIPPTLEATPQTNEKATPDPAAPAAVTTPKSGEPAPGEDQVAETAIDLSPTVAAHAEEALPSAQVAAEESLEDTNNAPQEHADLEKIAQAPVAGPDYWVGVVPRAPLATAGRDNNDPSMNENLQTMALLEASARGAQVPAPWATQPPAPGMTPPPAPWATQPPAPAMTPPPAPWATQPPAPAMTPPPAPWATQPPAPAMTPPPAPWATQPPYPAGTSPPSPGLTTPPGGSLFAQPPIGGTLNRGARRQRRESR